MNPCIKTGANVWDTIQLGAWHGDLYMVNGYYVLRHTSQLPRAIEKKECHAVFDTHKAFLNDQRTPHLARCLLHLEGAEVMIISDLYVKLNEDLIDAHP